jgi:hypothetical protein
VPVTTGIIYTVCTLSVCHKSDYILYGLNSHSGSHTASHSESFTTQTQLTTGCLFEGKMVTVNLVPTKMKMQDRVISPENSFIHFDFVFNKEVRDKRTSKEAACS